MINKYSNLTERESEILSHIFKGHTSIEIGKMICISPRTVEKHRQNMMSKMRVKNMIQLVKLSLEVNMLEIR